MTKLTEDDFNFQTKDILMTTNLPDGFEHMKMTKPYLRPANFKPGDTKLRFVCKPIAGWLDWKENKPLRFRPDQKPKAAVDPEKPIKPFWAVHCWDYELEGLYILEITQSSLLKAIASFAADKDFGDLTTYDLKFKKEGEGKNVKYQVMPLSAKPLGESIRKAIAASPVRLEALYDGGDPWSDVSPSNSKSEAFSKVSDTKLFDRVADMLAKEPEKDKLMKNFSEQFKVSGLLDASDEQLSKLEERLTSLAVKRRQVTV